MTEVEKTLQKVNRFKRIVKNLINENEELLQKETVVNDEEKEETRPWWKAVENRERLNERIEGLRNKWLSTKREKLLRTAITAWKWMKILRDRKWGPNDKVESTGRSRKS